MNYSIILQPPRASKRKNERIHFDENTMMKAAIKKVAKAQTEDRLKSLSISK